MAIALLGPWYYNHNGSTFPDVSAMSTEPAGTRQPLHGEVVFHPPNARQAPIEVLDLVSFLMDRCVTLPGTHVKVGLNALLLLLPVIGDIIPALVSVGILAIGLQHYRVPRIVAVRMVLNSLLDISLGWIPVVGDLFDIYFKADTRNVRLLQEYAGQGDQKPRATWRHWAFVLGLLGLVGLMLVLLVLGAVSLAHWIFRTIR
jgi:hypothetical protein